MWRTHVWARLSGQKGGQSLSVPVVGIKIHKYNGPGTALQSRNTVRDNILVKMNQWSCIYQRKRSPWRPNGCIWKPLRCVQQPNCQIREIFGILCGPQQQSGKSPPAVHQTFTMWLLQHNGPHHLNTSRQVRWGPLTLLLSRGSDQSFLVLKSCSTLLHPSISSSYIKLAQSLLQPAKPFLMQVRCIMDEQWKSIFSHFPNTSPANAFSQISKLSCSNLHSLVDPGQHHHGCMLSQRKDSFLCLKEQDED